MRLLVVALLLVPAGSIRDNLIRLGAQPGDHTYRVPASSMEPTLRCARPALGCSGKVDDRILVRPTSHLRRGEIVAFRAPPEALQRCGAGGTYVKRVIGLPGERIRERHGVLYVEGKKLNEPYVRRDTRSGSWTVPKGAYFILGDNRADSCDSRVWGSVRRANVIGRLVGVYWPDARFRKTRR